MFCILFYCFAIVNPFSETIPLCMLSFCAFHLFRCICVRTVSCYVVKAIYLNYIFLQAIPLKIAVSSKIKCWVDLIYDTNSISLITVISLIDFLHVILQASNIVVENKWGIEGGKSQMTFTFVWARWVLPDSPKNWWSICNKTKKAKLMYSLLCLFFHNIPL